MTADPEGVDIVATVNPTKLRPNELSDLLGTIAKLRGVWIVEVLPDSTLVYGRRPVTRKQSAPGDEVT